MKIKWAKYYVKYAVGAYYINEFQGRQNLCKNFQENSPFRLVDVNVCYRNLSTLKETSDLGDQDVKLILFSIDKVQKRLN